MQKQDVIKSDKYKGTPPAMGAEIDGESIGTLNSGPTVARRSMAVALGIAALLALYFTLVYYPGVLYTDSYVRWDSAQRLLAGSGGVTSFQSFGPTLLMALTYALTENYAAYTLVQSFFFFLSSLLLIRRFTGLESRWLVLPATVLAVVPLFPGYSAFHEASVGGVIAMNFLLILPRRGPERARLLAWEAAWLTLTLFILFSFRQNALTVIPVIAFLFWKTAPVSARVVRLVALVAALALVQVVPRALHFSEDTPVGISFGWEIAQTLQRLQDPRYDHYLDAFGDTRGALSGKLDDDIWSGLFVPGALRYELIGTPEAARRLQRDYFTLACAEPLAMLANKLRVWSRVLGLERPLFFYEFNQNRLGRMPEFGWRDTSLRQRSFERVEAMMRPEMLRKPWAVFLIGVIAMVIGAYVLPDRMRLAGTTLVLAAFYYAAFLITAPGYEFRYFFPAFYLVFMIVLALMSAAVFRGVSAAINHLAVVHTKITRS